jgi:hypothetical protein
MEQNESNSLKPVRRALANEGIFYVHVKTQEEIVSMGDAANLQAAAPAGALTIPWAQICDVLIDILEKHLSQEPIVRCNIGEMSMVCKRFDADIYSVIVYTKGHAIVKSINRIADRMMRKISRNIKASENRPVGAGHTGLVN